MVTALGMMVAELVTNSYGHAFPDRDGRIVVILTRPAGEHRGALVVQDDGVGFVATAESSPHGAGAGQATYRAGGGTLDLHSSEGTSWTMAFSVSIQSDSLMEVA